MSHLDTSTRRLPRGRRLAVTAAVVGAVLATGVPLAHAETRAGTAASTETRTAASGRPAAAADAKGWSGIARVPVSIDMGGNWTAKGELSYPRGAGRRLPLVVLLHGSGHNDMDETLPDGGSVFVPVAQTINHQGYAVLRFNKRGVTGVGPVLTDDRSQLAPPRPYEQIMHDAAAAIRVGAALPQVDPSRIFLLGHSEGTQVASNLAADPAAADIPVPAGVVAMGVVGADIRSLITYQLFGVRLAQLHEEFDVDGDGYLTSREAADGLIGQPAQLADLYRPILLAGGDVNGTTDRDHDGRLAIDAEVGVILRAQSGVDAYPDVAGIDQEVRDYLVDIARFHDVTGDLPRFAGPTLLLNGENDIQTPARAARVADAAVAAAGNRDHTLITYPGVGHTMNLTSKFTGALGEPDPAVLRDLGRWLDAHR